MSTHDDLEEGLGDGAVADRDDVNRERARDDHVQLPPVDEDAEPDAV
jgi:hypothetical protein